MCKTWYITNTLYCYACAKPGAKEIGFKSSPFKGKNLSENKGFETSPSKGKRFFNDLDDVPTIGSSIVIQYVSKESRFRATSMKGRKLFADFESVGDIVEYVGVVKDPDACDSVILPKDGMMGDGNPVVGCTTVKNVSKSNGSQS